MNEALHLEGGAADRRLTLPDIDATLAEKREGWLDLMKAHATRRWERIAARRTSGQRFIETEQRVYTATSGQKVPVAVAKNRSGGLALYAHGTGPFYTNRALRRSNGTRTH